MSNPTFPAASDLASAIPSVAEILKLGRESQFRPMDDSEAECFQGANRDALIMEHAGFIWIADMDEDGRFYIQGHRAGDEGFWESIEWRFAHGAAQIWAAL